MPGGDDGAQEPSSAARSNRTESASRFLFCADLRRIATPRARDRAESGCKGARVARIAQPSARKGAGIALILLVIVILGGIRRKPGASRRELACPGSGAILSHYGNSVDYPIETLD